MTEFPLLLDRQSSSTTRSGRRSIKVAVIDIDRIPAPTANSISKASNYSVAQPTNSHCGLVSLPPNPRSTRVISQASSAGVSSNLQKAMQEKINHLISSPFKQSTVSRMRHVHCFSPGEDLKLEILSEIEQIKKLQSDQKPLCCRRIATGQLLKARLKPLYPVVVEGPSTTQCRDILPGSLKSRSNPNRGMRIP
ncbi:uncharacterized protein [Scyliorhinus torazame]|uniref:uncharacterized protein isoform X2 n=1 Tax=Scyliorhinus torazame TaxID=75743 RepID=UPI003B59CE5A